MGFRHLPKLPLCILCQEAKELLKSHVVPDFFKKWLLTKTGGLPRFLNYHASLTKHTQDLTKHRLCCHDCEQLLSVDEGFTRQALLGSWLDGAAPNYEHWLARFAAGLALKAGAVTCYAAPVFKDAVAARLPANEATAAILAPDKRDQVLQAMTVWRDFLQGRAANPGPHEFHLFQVSATTYPSIAGAFGHFPVHSQDYLALNILLNGVVVVAVVQGADRFQRASRLAIGGGRIGTASKKLPWEVAEALRWYSDVAFRSQLLEAQQPSNLNLMRTELPLLSITTKN